jgi:hypothetical protein
MSRRVGSPAWRFRVAPNPDTESQLHCIWCGSDFLAIREFWLPRHGLDLTLKRTPPVTSKKPCPASGAL